MPPDLGLELTYPILFLARFFVPLQLSLLDGFSFFVSNGFNRFGTLTSLTSMFFGRLDSLFLQTGHLPSYI